MNIMELAYIARAQPILEKIEKLQETLKKEIHESATKLPYESRIDYISLGSKNYKSVPEFLYLKGINFLYTEFNISDDLVKKFSKKGSKTLGEAVNGYEQFDIFQDYRQYLQQMEFDLRKDKQELRGK